MTAMNSISTCHLSLCFSIFFFFFFLRIPSPRDHSRSRSTRINTVTYRPPVSLLFFFPWQQSADDFSQFDSKFTSQPPVDSPDDSTLSESANQVFLVATSSSSSSHTLFTHISFLDNWQNGYEFNWNVKVCSNSVWCHTGCVSVCSWWGVCMIRRLVDWQKMYLIKFG